MERTIHRVAKKNGRSGIAHGYAFTGWEYEEGWSITFSLIGRDPVKTVWVDSSTTFYCVPRYNFPDNESSRLTPNPLN